MGLEAAVWIGPLTVVPPGLIACDRRYLVVDGVTGHATRLAGMLISVLCEYIVSMLAGAKRPRVSACKRLMCVICLFRSGDTTWRCLEADHLYNGIRNVSV